MEGTLIDWKRVFEEETPARTAVMVASTEHVDNNFFHRSAAVIATYFGQYGEVETTRLGLIADKRYYVIQFKDEAAAADLIRRSPVVMYGKAFMVLPFQSNAELAATISRQMNAFTYPSYYTPAPPENSEENICNVLNDDCLDEIFRRIDCLSDMISIERVCTCFKRVAQSSFISVYKRNNVNFKHLRSDGDVNIITDIDKCLRRFGPSIVSACIDGFSYELSGDFKGTYASLSGKQNSILKLMSKYCPNLKKLLLHYDVGDNGEEIDSETLIEIRPLLSKLSHLTICHQLLSKCNDIIAACTELDSLTISHSVADSNLPAINLPNLKKFILCFDSGNGMLNGFLAHNPQIEELDIPNEAGVLRLIYGTIPKLQELYLTDVETIDNLDCVNLRRLRNANISMQVLNVSTVGSIENLFKLNNINRLSLLFSVFVDFNIMVTLMKHLCNLEEFCIGHRSSVDEQILPMDLLKEMLQHAKRLTKLKTFSIVHEFCEKDYNEILQIVKKRKPQLKLNFELLNINGDSSAINESKTFYFNADPRWLTIAMHRKQ